MARSAESDAHAELLSALSDASCDHSVEPDCGEQHARRAEDARKRRAELECEEPATLPDEITAASHQQRGPIWRLLRDRPVSHSARCFPNRQVLPVSSYADDLDALTTDHERTTDRRRSVRSA